MKKTLIFLTVFLFTVSVFAANNNNVASFTEWMQINGYTPSFPDDPGDIIEQWAAPNGSPMGIEWDADGDFIWHVSENAPNDCMYHIEVATPHNIIASYPCPNPYGIPDGGSMNGACIGNGYFYYTDYQGDLSVVDDHIVQVDRNTLAAVDQWEVDPLIDQILGITYKAPYFYVVCNSAGLIYEVDLQPGGVFNIISTITAPGGGPLSGIHYLEGNDTFWIASFLGGVVYETDSSFNILQTIPAPGGASAIGITWPGEGENYWLTDFGNVQFYIIDGDIVVSGQQTIQVDPLAVPYWTGTCTSAAFTDDSEARAWDLEHGYMMFDISAIPAGATILEIEFNGYVNNTNWPYWAISQVTSDPLTATAGAMYTDIDNGPDYNYYMESSTFPTGWKVDIIGGTANADLQAATVQGWWPIGIRTDDYYITYGLTFDGWDETNPPFLMVTYEGGAGAPQIAVDPTFIDEILDPDQIVVVPLMIENTGDAELTFDITIVEYTSDQYRVKNHISSYEKTRDLTQNKVGHAFNERDPGLSNHVPNIPATDDLFDWQFEWPVGVGGGEAGIETDGNYIYTTKWNGTTFFRYAMDGTYIEEFSVTGCSGGIRDLAYDGQYFYGAAATNTVYEMDFDTQTTISTITAPVAVRAIAYDEISDGFWANNWSDTITLFSRTGTTLNSFPCGVFQSYYGFAWENSLPGGPYLWGYAQDGPTLNQLVQFDIALGLETGVNLDIGSMFAVGTGIAGGVCISDAFVPGTWTICGTAQNTIIWGVELCLGDEPWISVNPISGTVPAGDFVIVDVTLNATDLIDITKTADIVIANNAGDDVIVPVTMEVTGTATLEVPTNVSVDPDLGLLTWDPPAGVAIYSDDFESYTVGEYLAVQSADWTTWSNNPGSAEDALISDVQALSGSNSVVVEGTTDLVLIMDNYTSGVYSMDLNLFVPTGYCGYWNLQKTSTPGQEWAFQIMFDVTGIATADAGAAAAFSFPFSFDTWINMELIVDLDADLCEIWVDGVMLHDYQWTLGTFGTPGLLSFGGMNLYAWASAGNSPLCYFDDIELNEITRDTRDLISYNVYLDDMGTVLANVGTDVFEYLYSGLINGEDYIAGVSAVYDAGESDIVQYPFTYTGVSADNIVNITTALRGNYPNPFNPVTNIAFSLGEATHVTLEVYNVKGEKVKTLVDKVLEANNHVITWDGRNNTNKSVASGIYFYKMKAEKYTATKKMILMK